MIANLQNQQVIATAQNLAPILASVLAPTLIFRTPKVHVTKPPITIIPSNK